MAEDFVSYDLAVKLKECGFDEPCEYCYDERGSIAVTEDPECFNSEKQLPIYARATLWQAHKWLRGEMGIAVNVTAHDGGYYTWERVFLPNAPETDGDILPDTRLYTDYESALSAGIEAVLGLLKKTNKTI